MKTTKFLILILAILLAGYSCQGLVVKSEPFITMVTNKSGKMSIHIAGTGSITIDWGDGTSYESHILSSGYNMYSHTYSITSAHTITIKGENITGLECISQQLTILDVSKYISLTHLQCINNKLTSLDVSKNIALTSLDCRFNQLTDLDVSKNIALTSLSCMDNKLTSLDVSKNIALTRLNCMNNKLTSLDVSKNIALTELYCGYNQLTNLDVSKNIALTRLVCSFNRLTELDVSKNVALTLLNCSCNYLSATALNDLFETLHDRNIGDKTINIVFNSGEENCDKSIATNKGWIFDDWLPI